MSNQYIRYPSLGGGGTVTSVSASSPLSSSGGATPNISLTGIVPIANGGTGQATANAALNALLPSQATHSGQFLTTDGTNASWAAVTGFANTALSNLASTAVNADILPATGNTVDLGTQNKNWAHVVGRLVWGTARVSAMDSIQNEAILMTTNATLPSGTNANGVLQSTNLTPNLSLGFWTQNDSGVNAAPTESIEIQTGNKLAGTGNSGGINIQSGTSAGGTRGQLSIRDGSEGTAGNVWTSTDTTGKGAWMPAGGSGAPGGANTQVQFNDSGSFGGDASLTYNKTSHSLTLGSAGAATGTFSLSVGANSPATVSGLFAVGLGDSHVSISGQSTFASGNGHTISADYGATCGGSTNTVSGTFSFIGGGTNNTISVQYAAAFGLNNSISGAGQGSLVVGNGNSVTGQFSSSFGVANISSGSQSATFGNGTLAQGDEQVAIGTFNIAVGTPGTPLGTDELFTVGNGTNSGARATTFAVLRAGDLQLSQSSGTTGQVLTSAGPGAPPFWSGGDVSARAFSSTTTISGTLATIVYATEDYDPSSAYNNTTGVYTVVVGGKYQINAALLFAGTIALNNTVVMEIQKNGTVVSRKTVYLPAALTDGSISISDILSCVATDTIRIQVSTNSTAPSIVSSNFDNYLSIARVA